MSFVPQDAVAPHPSRQRAPNLRLLALLLVLVAALLAACAPPVSTAPPPTTGGYVASNNSPLSAYTVRFLAGTPASIRSDTEFVRARLSALTGVQLSVGPDVSSLVSPATGEILVGVGLSCGIANEAGCATTYAPSTPRVVSAAALTIAPSMLTHSLRTVAVLHEFGHAMGLGHVLSTFAGAWQVMYPTLQQLGDYQAGDQNGLRDTSARGRSVLAARNPFGNLDSVTTTPSGSSAQLSVVGWAIDPDLSSSPLSVSVTIDGAPVQLTASQYRPDVAGSYPAYGPFHGFVYQTTVTPGPHTVCAGATNVSWGNANLNLGCRTVIASGATSGPTSQSVESPPGEANPFANQDFDPTTLSDIGPQPLVSREPLVFAPGPGRSGAIYHPTHPAGPHDRRHPQATHSNHANHHPH